MGQIQRERGREFMVTVRMFIPYMNMKSRFEAAVSRLEPQDDVRVELLHVFGTPESLSRYGDADILVARGMTYDRLRYLFPEKHVVEIQLSSFDILKALICARQEFHPKKIALCVRYMDESAVSELEKLCQAEIAYYTVHDEASTLEAIHSARANGADVFVGAGTMCGLCDKEALNRVHIHTKDIAIEQALKQAMDAARTINMERARSKMTSTILNTSSDALIAVSGSGLIQALNNQAYRTFQLSSQADYTGRPVEEVCPALKWKDVVETGREREEVIQWKDRKLYTEYRPVLVDKMGKGAIIVARYTEQIIEAETKIRQSLAKQGLTAKYSFDDIIGSSPAMRENILMAKRYSRVDSNVLIVGETGTGKELFAHSIHRESRRSAEPFVALNCAALPENLLESELFGYEPGAFSGASKNGKTGLFELAHKGTIFLDEINSMPLELQSVLLRTLQEKEIRRIGSQRNIYIDIRVIAASNSDLMKMIREEKFRIDLYYRLNTLRLTLPSLDKRREDIRPLAMSFLNHYSQKYSLPLPALSEDNYRLLENRNWQGNIRELRNVMQRYVILSHEGENSIQLCFDEDIATEAALEPQDVTSFGTLDEIEKAVILKRLKQNQGNRRKTAQELGISRSTLWKKLDKMELDQEITSY